MADLKRFRTLIDRTNDAIEVIDPQTLRFLDVNERACLDLGYSREELLSLRVCDIAPNVSSRDRGLRKRLGATADFSGVYHSGSNLYTYTFGPVVSMPKSGFSPFAHALFGGAHAASGPISDSGMAMMFGGGLDFGKRKLVFRAVQFDWMVLRFAGVTDKNNMRVNTGILYRF